MTPGINRAYQPNSLNKEGKLKSPTAAAGLGIYRGDPPQIPKHRVHPRTQRRSAQSHHYSIRVIRSKTFYTSLGIWLR